MKTRHLLLIVAIVAASCQNEKPSSESLQDKLEGSWQLLYSAHIRKDSVVRNDPQGTKMIKILNKTHFGFFQHNLDKKDSTGLYSSGGGTYTLKDSTYTEHLEFCSARDYEGNDFEFTISFHGDTLIQSGIEKLGDYGIGQENLMLVEKYLRIKK